MKVLFQLATVAENSGFEDLVGFFARAALDTATQHGESFVVDKTMFNSIAVANSNKNKREIPVSEASENRYMRPKGPAEPTLPVSGEGWRAGSDLVLHDRGQLQFHLSTMKSLIYRISENFNGVLDNKRSCSGLFGSAEFCELVLVKGGAEALKSKPEFLGALQPSQSLLDSDRFLLLFALSSMKSIVFRISECPSNNPEPKCSTAKLFELIEQCERILYVERLRQ